MRIITMPAHNEEATIGQVIDNIFEVISSKDRIIVVCDYCTDNTAQIAQYKGADVYFNAQQGLANAFKTEMAIALRYRPEAIVHIDADGQYEPEDIPLLLDTLSRGPHLVLGNRLHHRPIGMPITKYTFNKLGSLSYSVMLDKSIPDITTGFRAFTPSVATLPIISEFTYTQEQVYRAVKAGFVVKSVPITFYARRNGHSRLMKNSLHYIKNSYKDFRRFNASIAGKPITRTRY